MRSGTKCIIHQIEDNKAVSSHTNSSITAEIPVNTTKSVPTPLKIILIWTRNRKNRSSWNSNIWGQEAFTTHDCEYSGCYLTDDRRKVKDADIVYFHYNHLDSWPEVRYPHQLYAHRMLERPGEWHHWIKDYENKINITINFMIDAEISTSGKVYFERPNPSYSPYKPRIPLQQKRHSVVWPVSNCLAHSKRQDYVKVLSQYIDLHVYGRCGNYTCDKNNENACLEKFEKEYKFYISFENSVCDGYTTEKLIYPLRHELIPIAFGGSNYTEISPPNSFINIEDFQSPKHLAAYLHQLGNNESAYNDYFQWKQSYTLGRHRPLACALCKVAHSDQSFPAHTKYYQEWANDTYSCDNGRIDRMRAIGKW